MFLFYFFLACKTDKKQDALNKHNTSTDLKIVDEYTLTIIDSSYIGIGDRKQTYKTQDALYLFSLSGMQQKLEAVNLTAQKVALEINFERDDFLKEQFNFEDFYIHNLDSIFLVSAYNSKLALIDDEGQLNKVWNLNKATDAYQKDTFSHISITGTPSFFYNKHKEEILFRSFPQYNPNTDVTFFLKSFGVIYDLRSDSIKSSFGSWPEHFNTINDFFPNSHMLNYIPDFNKNVYYASYRNDHNIYKYDLTNNNLLATYYGKSKFLSEFKTIPRTQESLKIIDYITLNGSYLKLLYEKESQHYYRIVTHNQLKLNPRTQKRNNATFNRSFSVIVFNDKMKKIGEHLFENPEEFTFFSVIPYPDGLLINYKDSENENKNFFKFLTLK